MSISMINRRVAYTQKELINLVKEKMEKQKISKNKLFEIYKSYFFDREEFEQLLNDNIYFNLDAYKFLSEYLGMSISEMTKIIEDNPSEVSARGDVDLDLLKVLNYLFDQMIKHRRFNSKEKTSTFVYSKTNKKFCIDDCVKQIGRLFNIEEIPVDLFSIVENQPGFYVLRFPSESDVSGLTIIKDSNFEKEKYICIYVNTKEPLGRQKFTLAHELYHVFFEKSDFDATYKKTRLSNEIEKRAEEFASKLIIPRYELLKVIKKEIIKSSNREFSKTDIYKIQINFGVTFQSIIYALEISMKKDSKYCEYLKELPKVPEFFKSYFMNEEKWEEICQESKKYTNLNCIVDNFIFPQQFNKDLKESFQKSNVSNEEYNYIKSFFE